MRRIVFPVFILLLFIFIQNVSFSQQTENWLKKDNTIQYRKLYLHTDREFYFVDDTIWFKAYYLNGQTNRYISGFYNLYVDFLDENGQSVHNQVLSINEGIGSGSLRIPHSLESGNYVLRAFTEFQKSTGEESFFHKTLEVSKIGNTLDDSKNKFTTSSKNNIDIAFLPEGGYLLEREINIVGFKAVNEKGQGISIEGEIIDNNGEFVTSFNSSYKGLGKIYFMPLKGEEYEVRIKNYPDFKYKFTDIKRDGIKIVYKGSEDNQLYFHVTTNSELFLGKDYYFAILNKAKVLYHEKFNLQYDIFQIEVNQKDLPAGINKFVLLDKDFKPISERLYFSNNFNLNELKIKLNQDQYKTRSKVQIDMYDQEDLRKGEYSSLSLVVVDNNAINGEVPATNILSYLLIDSELKGYIESPSEFFTDDERLSSENKLNLLMLSQGWSKYIWNEVSEQKIETYSNQFEGLSIQGKAKRLLSKGPLIDGEIILAMFNEGKQDIYLSKTDTNGHYLFDSLAFTGEADIFIQALNKNGKSLTELSVDAIFKQNPAISNLYLPVGKILDEEIEEIYEQKYNSDLEMKAFVPDFDILEIEEVVIKAQKLKKEDEHYRTYGKAQTTLDIKEEDFIYINVLEYLKSARVPGVMQSTNGDYIIIRGIHSLKYPAPPLVLVDNVQIDFSELKYIPMSAIDKVEVLKTPQELAALGMRGTFGAISILTKQAQGYTRIHEPIRGVITKKINGYSAYREFYSPKYTPENINSKKPDHRITLYWNPNLITKDGKISTSFFTSDDISRFKVFVEGVTTGGKISIGTAEFRVE